MPIRLTSAAEWLERVHIGNSVRYLRYSFFTQDLHVKRPYCSRAPDDHADAPSVSQITILDMDGKVRIASCGVELWRNNVRASNISEQAKENKRREKERVANSESKIRRGSRMIF